MTNDDHRRCAMLLGLDGYAPLNGANFVGYRELSVSLHRRSNAQLAKLSGAAGIRREYWERRFQNVSMSQMSDMDLLGELRALEGVMIRAALDRIMAEPTNADMRTELLSYVALSRR